MKPAPSEGSAESEDISSVLLSAISRLTKSAGVCAKTRRYPFNRTSRKPSSSGKVVREERSESSEPKPRMVIVAPGDCFVAIGLA